MISVSAGYNLDYLFKQVAAGAENYYLSEVEAGNEPPGRWHGAAAEALGLTGEVDEQVMKDLYVKSLGPDGEQLGRGLNDFSAMRERAQATIAARVAEEGPKVLPERRRQIEYEELSKVHSGVPFFDVTLSLPKSVSVAWVAYRAAATKAREAGGDAEAARLQGRADAIERAMWAANDQLIRSVEAHAYTRTGHAGRETRDTRGVIAASFFQHTSREGDPQLHIHNPIRNLVQRLDGADEKWRTLDSRALYGAKLGIAADVSCALKSALRAESFHLTARADGNEFEVAGVEQKENDFFSSRRARIGPEIERLVGAFQVKYGRAPSEAELWSIKQHATLATRPRKESSAPAPEQELEAWETAYANARGEALADIPRRIESCTADAPPFGPDERHRCIEAAIAEVQAHHSTWTAAQLHWELNRHMPVELGERVSDKELCDQLTREALAHADVVNLAPAPCTADLAVLGVRADGAPVVQPPGAQRYATVGQLDTEDYLIQQAGRRVEPAVTPGRAAALLESSGLTPAQKEAAAGLLASDKAVDVFLAPAGAGKTYTIARYAAAYRQATGRRVVGLTTSSNAAEVLRMEGLGETYNIADWLGKLPDTDETRGHRPLYERDVLVVDEASRLAANDQEAIQRAAERWGAHVILTGDTEQLSAPGAGGTLRMIKAERGYWQLSEVMRFKEDWERDASLRLRAGDSSVFTEYDARGRVESGTEQDMHNAAVHLFLGDFLRGRDALLLASSDVEAASLSHQVRERLIGGGLVADRADVVLGRDGNEASVGDRVVARENWPIDTGQGRPLYNRDVIVLDGWSGEPGRRDAAVRRQLPGGEWSAPFSVPESYLAEHAQLAYAANTHAGEGRTIDRGHMVIGDATDKRSKYVGLTRGRERNTAYMVTSRPGQADVASTVEAARELQAPEEKELATAQAMWEAADHREADDLAARDVIRRAQEEANGVPLLFDVWKSLTREGAEAGYDEIVRTRLSGEDFGRYMSDPQRGALHRQLRGVELGGGDPAGVLARATERDMTAVRSVAAVLHGRVARDWDVAVAPGLRSFSAATPARAHDAARDAAAALDAKVAELGEEAAAKPPAWARAALGEVPAEDPVAREDWVAKAGPISTWRELSGYADPVDAVGQAPTTADPERHAAWRAASTAAGITPEEMELRAATDGELYARTAAAQRAAAQAPKDVARDLRDMERAAAFTEADVDAARLRGDERVGSYEALADVVKAEKDRLTVADAERRAWYTETTPIREAVEAAKGELARRGVPLNPDPEPSAEADVDDDLGLDDDLDLEEVEPDAEPGDARDAEPGDARDAEPGLDGPHPEAGADAGEPEDTQPDAEPDVDEPDATEPPRLGDSAPEADVGEPGAARTTAAAVAAYWRDVVEAERTAAWQPGRHAFAEAGQEAQADMELDADW